MSEQQPPIEDLLKTPQGARTLSEVWREKAEKATDKEEREKWNKAADDAWKTYLALSIQAFEERVKKFIPAARSARRDLQAAKKEAKASGVDDKVLAAIDAIMVPLDIIAPRKKKA